MYNSYFLNDFQNCEKLCLQYDVGNVFPSISRGADVYSDLKSVEIVASHVLYKNEFLLYLSDALSKLCFIIFNGVDLLFIFHLLLIIVNLL